MLRQTLGALVLGCALTSAASAQQAPSEAARAEARDIYAHVIGMDTSVEGQQTPAMAEYLAGRFRAAGFPAEDIHILPYTQSEAPGAHTADLVVRYRGDGTGGRPIMLIAHMDVVTAHRADWERDPFTMVEENGYFYGRGSFDNKAGLVLVTATLLQLKREGFRPTRDLIVAFTGDEETLGQGARMLANEHRDLIDAEFALNADAGGGQLAEDTGAPTGYAMQTAEKTYASFTITARNPGGHSSQPRPDNAIYDVADALQRVRAYAFPVMWNDTTIAFFRAAGPVTPAPMGPAMTRFAQHPGDRRAAQTMSAGATDGVYYRAVGIPTYGVGEIFIKDSDDFSHGLNERVPVTSFYNGLTHWRVLLTTLAGPRS